MEFKRTANAGVLLKLDGITILLDGVCKELPPYIGTPDDIREELTANFPDVLAFTHMHKDHYDDAYAELYKINTLRSVYGPESTHFPEVGGIKLQSVPTRHIGKADIPHASFVISGSKCVWFMGDASPLAWKTAHYLPKPDVLIVPYAYMISDSAWKITKDLGAEDIILVHMPERENDTYGLWETMEKVTGNDGRIHIPHIGETIIV